MESFHRTKILIEDFEQFEEVYKLLLKFSECKINYLKYLNKNPSSPDQGPLIDYYYQVFIGPGSLLHGTYSEFKRIVMTSTDIDISHYMFMYGDHITGIRRIFLHHRKHIPKRGFFSSKYKTIDIDYLRDYVNRNKEYSGREMMISDILDLSKVV